MAISIVGAESAFGTSVTIPAGHQTGDLMVMFAYRRDSDTPATTATGWTSFDSSNASLTNSSRIAFRFAASAAETSGTWTNATSLACHVYRGTDMTRAVPLGRTSTAAQYGNASTVSYRAQTAPMGAWVLAFVGHNSNDTAVETPPSGVILRTNVTDALGEVASFDSDHPFGTALSNTFPAQGVAAGGTAALWGTHTCWVYPTTTRLINYQSAKVGDGMATGERIR